jgi:hypothetical protein
VTRRWRIGLTVAAVLVAVEVALRLLGSLTGGTPGGPGSSSYATGATGVGAYAELLGRRRHSVDRLRNTPHELSLDATHTVVLLDPPAVARRDAVALRAFVAAGGRLVAGGESMSWTRTLLARPPTRRAGGVAVAHRLVAGSELSGVRRVRTAALRSWRGAGQATPLLGDGGRIVLAGAAVGRGQVLLLADPSPLQNRLLGRADNAALGLALAGAGRRPVDFLETYHGYGRGSGLGALPLEWKLLLGGLGLSAVVYMVARGRRFGPPEQRARDLAPPRHQYVDALGALLARTRRRDEAVAPVRRRARETLLRRAALPQDAGDDSVLAAARRLGLPDDEASALVQPAATDADVLAVGRALARIGQDPPR